MIKLLCRLDDPTAGQVLADGVDLREIDPRRWRAMVAVLFQDFIRYELPVADNVWLGPGGEITREDAIWAALSAAGAADTVRGLPSALATLLSSAATGGTELSGGQWQLVALARALFAVQGGARLLVLDEPTAALDPQRELDFFDLVLRLATGPEEGLVTSILVSHRFATVRHADRIVVLDGGRIVEEGSHEGLSPCPAFTRSYSARKGWRSRMTSPPPRGEAAGRKRPTPLASLMAWKWVLGVSFRADRFRALLAAGARGALWRLVVCPRGRAWPSMPTCGPGGQVAPWAAISGIRFSWCLGGLLAGHIDSAATAGGGRAAD